ncbi:hypothetical protein F8S13_21440 [Chloroflexia bacterium SDU3-3]|nr:hypothetical protein F8S13_21440 [Chloroflexia bacterium SDU3-3]
MSAASGLLHPNPARTWYATDALGSVRLTMGDTGAALSSIDYDPWGAVERGTVARFGFTGELQQGSSVHLRARWYNASSGSFASVDPYAGDPASPASLAPYMYAYNQPTGFTDPSGRCISWLLGPWNPDPSCQYIGNDAAKNGQWNYGDGLTYAAGAAGVQRDEDGNYDVLGYMLNSNPALSAPINAVQAIGTLGRLAIDEDARAAAWKNDQATWSKISNVSAWPGAVGGWITQPWTDFREGFMCNDMYRLGKGARGLGDEASMVLGVGAGVRALLAARAGGAAVVTNTAAGISARTSLIAELEAANIQFTANDIIRIGRTPKGKVVFLEVGKTKAEAAALGRRSSGFAHILEEHEMDFVRKGVAAEDIPDVIMDALTKGREVGYQGKGTERVIYEVMYKGNPLRIAVQFALNGYIIGANPRSMP